MCLVIDEYLDSQLKSCSQTSVLIFCREKGKVTYRLFKDNYQKYDKQEGVQWIYQVHTTFHIHSFMSPVIIPDLKTTGAYMRS